MRGVYDRGVLRQFLRRFLPNDIFSVKYVPGNFGRGDSSLPYVNGIVSGGQDGLPGSRIQDIYTMSRHNGSTTDKDVLS